MLQFPVPRWHELDGGRYIGTDDLVITRDPEEGWVNVGTYRIMVMGDSFMEGLQVEYDSMFSARLARDFP